MFVRYINSYKSHMGWKLQAYLYIRGLNDENVRSELMNLVKSSSFDDVAEKARLQQLIARSATVVLNRRRPPTSGVRGAAACGPGQPQSAVPPPPRGGRWKLLREAKRGTRWRLRQVTVEE